MRDVDMRGVVVKKVWLMVSIDVKTLLMVKVRWKELVILQIHQQRQDSKE